MKDEEIAWDEMSPELQQEFLVLNRELFENPDWSPPEGYTIPVTTIPAEMWDELFADE